LLDTHALPNEARLRDVTLAADGTPLALT